MISCPVCRAALTQGPRCRRCRADLSLLFHLRAQRDRAVAKVCQFLARGDFDRALAVGEGVEALHRDQTSQQLLALVHLVRREFARAWRSYRAARSGSVAAGIPPP